MRSMMIVWISISIYTILFAMDSQEKLQQDLREYWDKLKQEDKGDKNKNNNEDIQSHIQERDQENKIISMIAAHVAKL